MNQFSNLSYFFFPPLQVWTHKKKMPEFSFGIRHSQYLAPLIVDQADWTWTYILIHKFLGSFFSFFFLKRCYTEFFILRFEHISKSKKNFFFQVSSTFLALVYNILYDKKKWLVFYIPSIYFFLIYTFIKWWKFFLFFVCMYLPRLW